MWKQLTLIQKAEKTWCFHAMPGRKRMTSNLSEIFIHSQSTKANLNQVSNAEGAEWACVLRTQAIHVGQEISRVAHLCSLNLCPKWRSAYVIQLCIPDCIATCWLILARCACNLQAIASSCNWFSFICFMCRCGLSPHHTDGWYRRRRYWCSCLHSIDWQWWWNRAHWAQSWWDWWQAIRSRKDG